MTLRHLMFGLKSVPCNDSNAIALPFARQRGGDDPPKVHNRVLGITAIGPQPERPAKGDGP
jgi:hypothetical protein